MQLTGPGQFGRHAGQAQIGSAPGQIGGFPIALCGGGSLHLLKLGERHLGEDFDGLRRVLKINVPVNILEIDLAPVDDPDAV